MKPMLCVTLCLPDRSCAACATMANASSALLTSTPFACVVNRIRLSAVGRDSYDKATSRVCSVLFMYCATRSVSEGDLEAPFFASSARISASYGFAWGGGWVGKLVLLEEGFGLSPVCGLGAVGGSLTYVVEPT